MISSTQIAKLQEIYLITGIPMSIFHTQNGYTPVFPNHPTQLDFTPYATYFNARIRERQLPLYIPWVRMVFDSIYQGFVHIDEHTILQLGPVAADKIIYKRNLDHMKELLPTELVAYFVKMIQDAPKTSIDTFVHVVLLTVHFICDRQLSLEDVQLDINLPENYSAFTMHIPESVDVEIPVLNNPIYSLIESGSVYELSKVTTDYQPNQNINLLETNKNLMNITYFAFGAIAANHALLGGANERKVQSIYNDYVRKLLPFHSFTQYRECFQQTAMQLCLLVNQMHGSRFQSDVLRRAVAYIRDNLYTNIDLKTLEKETGANRRTLLRHFSTYMNTTPSEYIQSAKLAEVKRLLVETNISIIDISAMLGYSSQSHLNRLFSTKYGCTPRQFRLNGDAIQTGPFY